MLQLRPQTQPVAVCGYSSGGRAFSESLLQRPEETVESENVHLGCAVLVTADTGDRVIKWAEDRVYSVNTGMWQETGVQGDGIRCAISKHGAWLEVDRKLDCAHW